MSLIETFSALESAKSQKPQSDKMRRIMHLQCICKLSYLNRRSKTSSAINLYLLTIVDLSKLIAFTPILSRS